MPRLSMTKKYYNRPPGNIDNEPGHYIAPAIVDWIFFFFHTHIVSFIVASSVPLKAEAGIKFQHFN